METFEIDDCEIVAETTKAVKIVTPDIMEEDDVWIPQSQIDDASPIWKKGETGTLIVTQWIAAQKGLDG